MPPFRLRTFGRLSIERDGVEPTVLANQRKGLALLAVLAASRAGISRDRLMALLWPESDTTRARGALKQLLHSLRRQLGDADAVLGSAELRLNRDIVEDDASLFREALARGDDAAATALYEGPFLDGTYIDGAGEFERWLSTERDELARLSAGALERLAIAADRAARRNESVALWRRLQTADPLNGRFALGLIRALDAAGDRGGALRHARLYQTLLHEELGAPPDRDVADLAERLTRGDRMGEETAPAAEVPGEATNGARQVRHNDTGVTAPPVTATVPGRLPVHPAPSRQRPPLVRTAAAALLLAIVVVVSALSATRRRSSDAAPVLQPGRVAVSVLVNRTGDPSLDALGTMASDWVTRGLARTSAIDVFDVGGLYLGGRTAEGAATDPRALARANGASLVVAGNYYRTGDSLLFSVQVVDVPSGRVARALDPVATPVGDPVTALDELRQRIAAALGTLLDPRGEVINTPLLTPPTYDAYLQFAAGQDIYWRGDWEASLPYFRRAAELDTTFFTAVAYIGVVAVGTGNCALTDSTTRVLEERGERVAELDRLTAEISQARCRSDHAEHNRLQRRRAALMPGSKFLQFTMSTGFRQQNLAAEAQAILNHVNPARDLGWLRQTGRSFYWREVASVHHALGDFRAERAAAARMQWLGGSPLGVAYFSVRSLAALGHGDSVLTILDSIVETPGDPALLSGITGGRMNAVAMATPGWVMFQGALELAAHGDAEAGTRAMERSITWFERHGTGRVLPVEQRWLLAQGLAFAGRLDEGRQVIDALVREHPGVLEFRGVLGGIAARQGDTATVRAVDTWLSNIRDIFPPGAPMMYRADIAGFRGDPLGAMELIDGLPHRVHPYDWLHFHVDPALAELRESERFRRFLMPKG